MRTYLHTHRGLKGEANLVGYKKMNILMKGLVHVCVVPQSINIVRTFISKSDANILYFGA